MWLNQDICSFQCLLCYLSIHDILSLASVSREVSKYVKSSCQTCRHLPRIENGDLSIVTDLRRFPKLEGFSELSVRTLMRKKDTRRLIDRWSEWDVCFLSTRNHTRRALGRMLLRAKCLRHIGIEVDNRCEHALIHLVGPVNGFVRRNSQIQRLTMTGVLSSRLLKPFRRTTVRTVVLDGEATTPYELSTMMSCLPTTVEHLTVIGRTTGCRADHCTPTFLLPLLHKPNLRELVCIRSISTCCLMCDAWTVLGNFCENTTVASLVIDVLRVDNVAQLASRGFVKKIDCGVKGCRPEHFEGWAATLPSVYSVRFAE